MAERRQVTILFCDLVGSVSLADTLDPEDFQELVLAYRELAVREITSAGGTVARFMGDGILAYFGYPTAFEEAARRSVHAGLAIMRALASPEMPASSRSAVNARIGIHTGPAIIGTIGEGASREMMGVLGEAPNLAARFETEATPGTVVFGPETFRLVSDHFVCRSLGLRSLKGLNRTIELFVADGERKPAEAPQAPTPMIGRTAELSLLGEHWHSAVAGKGGALAISGEPGIGKTRLVRAFVDQLANRQAAVIMCQCSPFTEHSAWFPVIDLLRRKLALAPNAGEEDIGIAVAHALEALGLPREPLLSSLTYLLSAARGRDPESGVSPQQQRQRLHDALVAGLSTFSAQRPILIVIEDLHWMDASTRELLASFLNRVESVRALVILTLRSQTNTDLTPFPIATQLPLGPLKPQDVFDLVRTICLDHPLPDPILRDVIAKTDGNPMFVEELTKAAVEAQSANPAKTTSERLVIPITLRDSLLARLDRLGPARALAQVASVFGHTFSINHLLAIAGEPASEFNENLNQLVNARIIEVHGDGAHRIATYRHSLIQNAAYETLLLSTRRNYHRRIAELFAGESTAIVGEHPELAAQHFAAGGVSDKAIEYWRQAANLAASRGAYKEAIAQLTQARDALSTIESESLRASLDLDIHLLLGARYLHTRGNAAPEVLECFTRARLLCETVRDPPRLFAALRGLKAYYSVSGHNDIARQLGEQLVHLGRLIDDKSYVMLATRTFGQTLFMAGDLRGAAEQLDSAIELTKGGHRPVDREHFSGDAGGIALCSRAMVSWLLCRPKEAQERMREALDFVPLEGDPHARAFVLGYAAWLAQCRNDLSSVLDFSDETLRLAVEHGLEYWVAWGRILRSWARIGLEMSADAVEELRCGIEAYTATGAGQMRSYFLMLYANVLRENGKIGESLKLFQEALSMARKSGIRFHEPEIQRLIAISSSAEGKSTRTGGDIIEEGLTLARRQGSVMLQIRCLATGLELFPDSSISQSWRDELHLCVGELGQERDSPEISAAVLFIPEASMHVSAVH